MKSSQLKPILKQVLEKVKPSEKELKIINNHLKSFLNKLGTRLKLLNVDAEIFVGGSFAKKTVIKKDYYDIDVFVRFNPNYKNEEISGLTEKALKKFQNIIKIHGSRDYFRMKISDDLFIEIIPVKKVKGPRQAENITDLSYSHVKYMNKKAKSQKVLDEILLTKAFCYATQCYGAESYIKGFSGYGLELLIYYYGSFLKFIKTMVKVKDKIIIDIEKHYKNKQTVLMDVNSSKLNSPIILIDPTYKQRNALAALSKETFEKFKKECENFLKTPSLQSFEIKKTDLNKIKQDAEKSKYEFILLELKTIKQEGDIAGSKLLKFYNHLANEIEKYFEIKNKGFNYNNKKSARYFFVVQNRKNILFNGPNIKDSKNIEKFKKQHKNTFVKSGKIYAREPINYNIKEFVEFWKKKNKKKIKEMTVEKLVVIE